MDEGRLVAAFDMLTERLFALEDKLTWSTYGCKSAVFKVPVVYYPPLDSRLRIPNDNPGLHHDIIVRLVFDDKVLSSDVTVTDEDRHVLAATGFTEMFDVNFGTPRETFAAGDRRHSLAADMLPAVAFCALVEHRLQITLGDDFRVGCCVEARSSAHVLIGLSTVPRLAVTPMRAVQVAWRVVHETLHRLHQCGEAKHVDVAPALCADELVKYLIWHDYRQLGFIDDRFAKQDYAKELLKRLGTYDHAARYSQPYNFWSYFKDYCRGGL